MLFCLIVVVLVLLVVLDRWKSQKFKKVHNQLGCDFYYLPVIGHSYILFGEKRRVRSYASIARQCYRNKHCMISFWLYNRLFVGISDPVQARAVLKSCLDKGLSEIILPVLGNISAFTPVEDWKHRRKIMRSVLAPRFIKHYLKIFLKHSEDLCDRFSNEASENDFSTSEYFFTYSLDTICETAIGIVRKTKNVQNQNPVKKAIEESLESLISRFCQPWQHVDVIYKLSSNYWKKKNNKKIIREYVTELFLTKKLLKAIDKIGTPENAAEIQVQKTILELLMEFAGDDAYTEDEILKELIHLIIASTDTTTLSAGFICVLLSLYPDVQEKACTEVTKVLGISSRKLKIKDLDELVYIEAVIKEVTRLYPAVPMILRICDRDIQMPTGIILPKGTGLLTNILGINRNPHYWGSDAEEFRPERFLKGYPSSSAAFMSFSYGSQNCAGYNFAIMSLKILFSTILRRYHITPTTCSQNEQEEKCTADIMIRSMNDFKVQIRTRK